MKSTYCGTFCPEMEVRKYEIKSYLGLYINCPVFMPAGHRSTIWHMHIACSIPKAKNTHL